MAYKYTILVLIACMLEPLTAHSSFIIRVLLDSSTTQKKWILSSKHGFIVWDRSNPHQKEKIHTKKCSIVRTKNGLTIFNGKKVLPEALCIAPQKGYTTRYHHADYHGIFTIVQTSKKTLLINSLDIEDYVFSVLKSESWPGWPLEVNKVFAIACRSYALSIALQARNLEQWYDIKNSNIHQTYKGTHDCAIIKRAVETTRGTFLAHNKKPITAMFDCCCGGVIPAHIDGVDFTKAPYLARTYPCTYCTSCSLYKWDCSFDISFLEEELSKIHGRIKRLRKIVITQNDRAGLVKSVRIHSATKNFELTGKQFYSLFKEVKSFSFTIHNHANNIKIKGNGYGHHLGLCQWGTRQMVRDGHDYKSILLFYYPDTSFMRITQNLDTEQ